MTLIKLSAHDSKARYRAAQRTVIQCQKSKLPYKVIHETRASNKDITPKIFNDLPSRPGKPPSKIQIETVTNSSLSAIRPALCSGAV